MRILAINPWIVDCAAYDFWLKPYGFLVLLTYLKKKNIEIDYIDCLDKKIKKDSLGRGKFYSEAIPKPEILNDIPRKFKRYGISVEEFRAKINDKRTDLILITSSMTYWYLGIKEVEKILKENFDSSPKILGGIYPVLVPEHAEKNFPSFHIFSSSSLEELFSFLNIPFNNYEFYTTLPIYENFYHTLDYVVLRTSWGCPFNCSFCAIKKLFPSFLRLPKAKIIEFITKYYERGVKNFVLYDDAFLYPPQEARELLEEIKKLNLDIKIHTPNALHLRFLDENLAYLLKECGFFNPHFGLETLNPELQKEWGDKVNKKELLQGIKYLKKAGFREGEFSIYLLLGFPQQNLEELKKDIEFLHRLGAKISLAEYSPTPGTRLFEEYKEELKEPLLHNNSIFYFFNKEMEKLFEIKNFTRQLNKRFF